LFFISFKARKGKSLPVPELLRRASTAKRQILCYSCRVAGLFDPCRFQSFSSSTQLEYPMALPSSFLRRTLLTAISATTLVATSAYASPAFTNARALAMGGTGVATAHPAAAAALNPAMMAATHHEWRSEERRVGQEWRSRASTDPVIQQ